MKNHHQTILSLRGLACATLIIALAACGQKGALFAPSPPPSPKPAVSVPASPASAASAPLTSSSAP